MPLLYLAICLLLLQACGEEKSVGTSHTFRNEVVVPHTPVRNQGRNQTCWAYAMLSTMESNNLTRGDSVTLSVNYAIRQLIEENYVRHYLTRGQSRFTTRATAQTLLNLVKKYGMIPDAAYPSARGANTTALCEEAQELAQESFEEEEGMQREKMERLLETALGNPPQSVFHSGEELSPREFADRLRLIPGEYEALTSFTHHPFFTDFVLEVPDNWEGNRFYNLPIDSLMTRIEEAVRRGESVCWEGDTSEPGFSFRKGIAEWATDDTPSRSSQEERQRLFEDFRTTDDHAMSIIGLARNEEGHPYFIMKNSWGKGNPYGGLVYVSFEYARMKTVAVWVRIEKK